MSENFESNSEAEANQILSAEADSSEGSPLREIQALEANSREDDLDSIGDLFSSEEKEVIFGASSAPEKSNSSNTDDEGRKKAFFPCKKNPLLQSLFFS